jgi:serine/threonine protein kinase
MFSLFASKGEVGEGTIHWNEIILEKEIGKEIYSKATYNEQTVTLKKFEHSKFKNETKKQCVGEFEILNKLNHENIAKALGYAVHQKNWFLILENSDTDLETTKSLTMENKLKYLNEIAEGFYYLHSQSVIHRNLRPNNVLV